MSATPGSLDFSKLAAEATKGLEAAPATTTVKVASSEGGVPPPSNEQVAETIEQANSQEETSTVETQKTSVQTDESQTVKQDHEEQKAESQQTQQAVEAKEFKDSDKVKVKIDGKEEIITYGEYKDVLRKNATITQRMQQFAKSRDEFNTQVQQTLAELDRREQAIKEASTKRDPLYDTILSALKGQVEPKPRDPNEIVTLKDVQEARAQMEQEFTAKRDGDKKAFEQQLVEAAKNLQAQAQVQNARQAYANGLNEIMKSPEYAPLREVSPNFDASVMYHVQSLKPETLEEALEYSKDYIKERHETFKKYTVAQRQEQQKEAVRQKMESSDGTTPTIVRGEQSPAEKAKKFVQKSGKLDWGAMQKDALARINSMN